MGAKPRKSLKPRQVRKIRSINRRLVLIREAKMSVPEEVDRLMTEKDRLIDEMEKECACENLRVGCPDSHGPDVPLKDMYCIACIRCARTDIVSKDEINVMFPRRIFVGGQFISRREHAIWLGQLCMSLGINI